MNTTAMLFKTSPSPSPSPSPSKPHQYTRSELIHILVDETVLFIQYIWPNENSKHQIIPLRIYIQEILRRSHTSFSTLLVALIYLFRLKTALSKPKVHPDQSLSRDTPPKCGCGRRMFLAALIVAAKFLQDRGATNNVWSRLSGLSVKEINENEREFLKLLNYNIFVTSPLFSWWSTLIIDKIDSSLEAKESVSDQGITIQVPFCPATRPVNEKKRASPNMYSPYPSTQPKYRYSSACNLYYFPGVSRTNIELSPPFIESSSEDEE